MTKAPPFEELNLQNKMDAIVDSYRKKYPTVMHEFGKAVVHQSSLAARQKKGWTRKNNSISKSLSVRKGSHEITFYTSVPHGYLTQYGETMQGKEWIYPVNKSILFINNTGLSNEEFAQLNSRQRNRYTRGVDYIFTTRTKVTSNPYLAYYEFEKKAKNLSQKYRKNSLYRYKANAKEVYEARLKEMMQEL